MKPTPFEPMTDLAPIFFSPELCHAAERLKKNGLSWKPHVGCFVWDKDEYIKVSSPFPNRIYFILNLGHFLKIFDTLEKISEQLIWIPTWNQARQICEKNHIAPDEIIQRLFAENALKNDLLILYEIILENLKKNPIRNPQ